MVGRKFVSLQSRSRTEAGLLDPDSVITNISDYELSRIEKLALTNGLKFHLPPKKLKSGSYLANFELLNYDLNKTLFCGNDEDEVYFREKLSEIAYSSYFNYNSSRCSIMNIPRDQHKALISLSKNKDIVIICPDKESGVVIMNRTDYVKKVEDILHYTSKFKVCNDQDVYTVSRRIERKVRKFLLDHLKKPGYITEEQYKRLYPNALT